MTEAGEAPPTMEFRPVTPDRWPDLARLFEARGGPKHCWCMVWRPWPTGVERSPATKRAELERTTLSGTPVGILAYVEGEPVAWCSVAPRETYRAGLYRPSGDEPDGVWSLACFFVPRRLRKRGIARGLLDAAVEHASSRSASVVEAYPVDPDSPSYGFMGRVPLFEAAGFREVGTAGSRRHVMRLEVGEG